MKKKWTAYEKFLFATQKLRAGTIPDRLLCMVFFMTDGSMGRQFLSSDQEARFWSKVTKGECWVWTGATNNKGYGAFGLDGKTTSVHRISYMIHKGEIPDGMVICHACNNPPCVNPDHLYLGTAHDNMRQAANEGRLAPQQKTHCKNGHEFTPENTKLMKQGSKPGRDPNATYRVCRECLKAQRKKRIYTPERKQYHAEYWQKHKGVPKADR